MVEAMNVGCGSRLVHHSETINMMITRGCPPGMGNHLISYRLNSTNPYEGIGKRVVQEIYSHCDYKLSFAKNGSKDRIIVFRNNRQAFTRLAAGEG